MWSNDLQSIVYTNVKMVTIKKLKERFPNINIVTSSKEMKKAKFPTVRVQKLPGMETGADLRGETVNAVVASFQIDVVDNGSQANADDVADVVFNIMKRMRFQIVGEPAIDESDPETFRNTARYRRIIGAGDNLTI